MIKRGQSDHMFQEGYIDTYGGIQEIHGERK